MENVDLMTYLLDHGAKTELHDKSGMTGLMYAIESGKTNVVQLLIDRGANPLSKDNQGRKALDYVQRIPMNRTERDQIVKVLQEAIDKRRQ